jgi:hypothetical protein
VSDPGQVIYTFGPFGTAVCPGPYGIFKWQKSNMTRVELTAACLRGRKKRSFFIFGNSSPGGEVVFEIPYVNIRSLRRYDHPAKLGVMDVLEFTFVSGAEQKVLSIAAYKGPAAQALEVIRQFVPAERIQA